MKESVEESHDTPFKSVSNSQQQACFAGMYRGERSFLETTNDNQIEAQIPFEQSSNSFGESTFSKCKTPFMDHEEGEGIYF